MLYLFVVCLLLVCAPAQARPHFSSSPETTPTQRDGRLVLRNTNNDVHKLEYNVKRGSHVVHLDTELNVERVLCNGASVTIYFNQEFDESNYKAGQIIIGGKEWGCYGGKNFALRITEKSSVDGMPITVSTTPATLQDVYEDGVVSFYCNHPSCMGQTSSSGLQRIIDTLRSWASSLANYLRNLLSGGFANSFDEGTYKLANTKQCSKWIPGQSKDCHIQYDATLHASVQVELEIRKFQIVTAQVIQHADTNIDLTFNADASSSGAHIGPQDQMEQVEFSFQVFGVPFTFTQSLLATPSFDLQEAGHATAHANVNGKIALGVAYKDRKWSHVADHALNSTTAVHAEGHAEGTAKLSTCLIFSLDRMIDLNVTFEPEVSMSFDEGQKGCEDGLLVSSHGSASSFLDSDIAFAGQELYHMSHQHLFDWEGANHATKCITMVRASEEESSSYVAVGAVGASVVVLAMAGLGLRRKRRKRALIVTFGDSLLDKDALLDNDSILV